jgi:hypothetical protein
MKMKKFNYIPIILLAWFSLWTVQKAGSQPPVFTDTLIIDQTFTSDTTIFPFAGQSIYGIAANGNVQFNSYNSYVRILVADNSGDQFIILESYPMLDTIWNFNFNTHCDESCYLNNFQATSIVFHILDASITLDNILFTEAHVESAGQLQYNAKLTADLDKINRLNAFLEHNQMLWRAGVTEYSNMYFKDRGQDSCRSLSIYTYGFEYYLGGVFEIFGRNGQYKQPTYDIAPRFDWRSRHGADQEGSSYYDGDTTGSGWMTPVRCQEGCWVETTEEWLCITESECNQLGGLWRTTGACTSFSTIATVEGFANLYYNQHVDFDLSEQQLASNPMGNPPYDNCGSFLVGGSVGENYEVFVDYGVIGEDDFPFQGDSVPCDQQQYPPDENVSLFDFHQYNDSQLSPEIIKKLLIEHGPITWTGLHPYTPNHALTLVGFDVLTVGDKYTIGWDEILEVGPRHSRTDVPIWIFKDSYGINSRLDGYFYVILDGDGPISLHFPEKGVEEAIMSLNYGDEDIMIRDEDNDGYLSWGIGDCEGCPGERDGDDNNPSLGPMDENGFCRIIDAYTTSFEGKSYENWRQIGEDDFDWLKHNTSVYGSGPDSAYHGDFYFVMEGATDPGNNSPYDQAVLESPTIELNQECLILLNFHYFRYYSDGGLEYAPNLFVEASTNNGTTWNRVWTSDNPSSDPDWNEATVTLVSDVNKIRFVGEFGAYPTQHNLGFDLISLTPYEQTGPLVISRDTSFGGEVFACNDIEVEPEVTLTLNSDCILHMPENSKIIVKRRASLIVNGATITCDGPGQWKGIEVWGDGDLPGKPVMYQGYVNISNGATIENAVMALFAGKDYGSDHDRWQYSGGVVFAEDALFVNNTSTAVFDPYRADLSEMTKFLNCTSIINDDYAGETNPVNIFKLWSIDGIQFADIIIHDMRSNIPVTDRAIGILATGSDFNILTTDTAGTYTNSFSNLLYGIKSMQTNTIDNFKVKNSTFNNCLRGIYSSGATGDDITQCRFQPWENANPFLENYGIYLDECTGYIVEENLFENDIPATRKGNGIVINNSGSEPNEVYRNTFIGLDYGIIAQNENRDHTGLTGLCLKCNDFVNCNFDIVITKETGNDNPRQGIAANQGAISTNAEDMAGNLFHIEHPIPDGDFDDINNQANFITYYYPHNDMSNSGRIKPVDYTTNTVGLYMAYNDWSYELGCPSNQSGGGGGSGEEAGLIVRYIDATTQTDSLQNILDVLVDAGDTDGLTSEVQGSVPPEAMEIYNELMNVSPYLSDTVVGAAIQKEDVLPGVMVRNIMVANPNTAKSKRLMQQLNERWNPLPDYMIAQILQGRSLISIREKTEATLTRRKLQKSLALQALFNYYLANTVNPQSSHEQLVALLENDDALQSKFMLAFFMLSRAEIDAGMNVLSDIPASLELTAHQQQTYQGMLAYYQLLTQAMADTLQIFQPDSATSQQLLTLMNTGNGLPSVFARNILLSLDETEYLEAVILPDPYKSARAEENYQAGLQAQTPALISVKPNPA